MAAALVKRVFAGFVIGKNAETLKFLVHLTIEDQENGVKLAQIQLTENVVVFNFLQNSVVALKMVASPGMGRAKATQVCGDVQRKMLIWS